MKKETLKRLVCFVLALPLALPLGGCGKQKPEPAEREYNEQGYRVLPFSRGIVMSALEYPWYPFVSTYWSLKKSKTYADVRQRGFDHIRVPVDFRLGYDKEKKQMKRGYMRRLDRMLDKAEAAGLYVMLDFHGWYDLNTDKPEQKETFLTIWRLVAEHYRDRSDFLVFELLNEPHTTEGGNLDAEHLNKLQNEVISVIRESNPDRLILAACAEWNGWWTLGDLRLPRDDKNLAVAVHCYEPMSFTHQGASWAGPEYREQVRLTPAMLKKLSSDLDRVLVFRKATGVQVVINEFGVGTELAVPEDVTAYLAYLTAYCEENDLAWTYMGYYLGSDVGRRTLKPSKQAVLDGLFRNNADKTETKGS